MADAENKTPQTAEEFVLSGIEGVNNDDYKDAVNDFTRAIKLYTTEKDWDADKLGIAYSLRGAT